jgi:hypothetical protein
LPAAFAGAPDPSALELDRFLADIGGRLSVIVAFLLGVVCHRRVLWSSVEKHAGYKSKSTATQGYTHGILRPGDNSEADLICHPCASRPSRLRHRHARSCVRRPWPLQMDGQPRRGARGAECRQMTGHARPFPKLRDCQPPDLIRLPALHARPRRNKPAIPVQTTIRTADKFLCFLLVRMLVSLSSAPGDAPLGHAYMALPEERAVTTLYLRDLDRRIFEGAFDARRASQCRYRRTAVAQYPRPQGRRGAILRLSTAVAQRLEVATGLNPVSSSRVFTAHANQYSCHIRTAVENRVPHVKVEVRGSGLVAALKFTVVILQCRPTFNSVTKINFRMRSCEPLA